MAETIRGLRELQRALHAKALDMQRRVARRAVAAGAQVVKEAVAEAAGRQPTLADKPYTHGGVTYQPGHVARNVIAKNLPEEVGGLQEAIVAVRSNKANGYAGKIASLNEFGTVNMGPQPFMRPGFESSKTAAVAAIVDRLKVEIEKP